MDPETYVTIGQVVAAWPKFAKLAAEEQQALIDAACGAIHARLRRQLVQQTYVETHSGKNRSRIWLRVRPVVAVTALSIDGDAIDNSTGTGWAFNAATGELVRGDGRGEPRFGMWFPSGTSNIRVVYAAGFDPIPAAIQRAAILTAQALHAASRVSGAFKSESLGDWSYTLNDGVLGSLPPVALSLIGPYIQDEIL